MKRWIVACTVKPPGESVRGERHPTSFRFIHTRHDFVLELFRSVEDI